ncbi:hypothetical protein V8O11_22595 [Erwinia aphidicola]|uniref:hypothetical protein n=1 Tax=Erwinia aphidicola TaxID=68334 RepID=UPI00300DBC0E
MKDDNFDDDSHKITGDWLSLESSFVVGELCFRMMAQGEAPLRAALTSTLREALASEQNPAGPGALSLQLAIKQLETGPANGKPEH